MGRITMPQFSIGADPEFFLETSKGELRSAIGVLEGTKYEQQKVESGGLQRDNVAAEFSCTPSEDEDTFIVTLGNVLRALRREVLPLRLSTKSSAEFPKDQLKDEEAKIFGCDPDFNCWTVECNYIPDEAPYLPFRSCGGHIHIGRGKNGPKVLAEDNFEGMLDVVKALDLYVGVTSVLLDNSPETKKRRTLYGKAGAHRPKPYGLEYRTLSNFWMMSPKLARVVYRLTALALAAAESGDAARVHTEIGSAELQRIINECDVDKARTLFDAYIKPYLKKDTLNSIKESIGKAYNVLEEWD